MKHLIKKSVSQATSLEEIETILISIFHQVKNQAQTTQIGYVSGIITSDGPEFIQRNIKVLIRHTKRIRKNQQFPIFSATDIFNDDLFKRLQVNNYKNTDYEIFWDKLLRSGHVTDIFMTPRWQESRGCNLEHAAALELKLKIYYL